MDIDLGHTCVVLGHTYLDPAAKKAVFYGNAARLLKL